MYTALQAVNRILKRVKVVQGDSAAITSFTDTTKQHSIDLALQIMNELIHELYSRGVTPQSTATGTITLATDTREYSAPSDFEMMAGENYRDRAMISADNVKILEYPGGYLRMFSDQTDPSDYTGRPNLWAINTTNGNFRLDRTPSSDQSGDAYTFLYQKRLAITTVSDTFAFSDTVFDALMPVIANAWSTDRNADARAAGYSGASFIRALKVARQSKARSHYGVRSV